MSLFCPDGEPAAFPASGPPPPKPERGAPWKPPTTVLCERCSRASWQHTSHPPTLADDLARAIYAAAFVAAVLRMDAHDAIADAERIVKLHRRARSGA